jgi:hypothetical protein
MNGHPDRYKFKPLKAYDGERFARTLQLSEESLAEKQRFPILQGCGDRRMALHIRGFSPVLGETLAKIKQYRCKTLDEQQAEFEHENRLCRAGESFHKERITKLQKEMEKIKSVVEEALAMSSGNAAAPVRSVTPSTTAKANSSEPAAAAAAGTVQALQNGRNTSR